MPTFQVWMFGCHPVPHHLLSLSLFIVTACLLYRLLERILRVRGPALVGNLFSLTRSAHFLSFYWVSASAESRMSLCFLLALITVLRAGTDGGRPGRTWLAMYGLSLLRLGVVLPAIAGALCVGFYTRDGDENSPDRIPPGPYTQLRLLDGRFVAFQHIRESRA